jgi:hypothetical protein
MTLSLDFTTASIRFSCRKGSRRLRIELPGMPLGGVSSQVVLPDGSREDVVWTQGRRIKGGMVLRGVAAGGSWTLRVSGETNARGVPGLRLAMSGSARRSRPLTGLAPFVLPRLPADHLLIHGRSAGGCHALVTPNPGETIKSHCLLMVRRAEAMLQIAQPLEQDNPSEITGRFKGAVLYDLAVTTPFSPEAGADRLVAEPVSLFAGADGHALMEAWAEAQAPEAPRPEPRPVAGWNSWDYYRWTVTEEAVLQNAEFIAADPVLSRHVKRLIIDDGWQYAYGEWEANPLFPHGMGWMARRLAKLGFEPGIWMAPGIVEPHARIAQWDPDMLACGASGLPCLCFNGMERQGFVLDPTVPKTRRWLLDLFSRHADMGFRYFKLDFLIPVATAPCYDDPSVPRGRIVKMLLEPARQALNGRAQIMGCGYDFHAGMDYVDEVRTSSDIHARWDSICENVGSIAGRWWAQGRWWGNDPDFALARGPQTSIDPDLHRLKPCLVFVKPKAPKAPAGDFVLATMNRQEARTLLGLVVISGGAVNLSDDLTKLNAEGLDLVRRTVAGPRGAAGVPLDLFRSPRPAQWLQRTSAGWRVLLVNWSDEPREITFDLRAFGIDAERGRDFWTDAVVKVRDGVFSRPLPSHASLLVEFPRHGTTTINAR